MELLHSVHIEALRTALCEEISCPSLSKPMALSHEIMFCLCFFMSNFNTLKCGLFVFRILDKGIYC